MSANHHDIEAWIFETQATQLADSAQSILAAVKELGIEKKSFVPQLEETERAMLAGLGELPETLRQKLASEGKRITVVDAVQTITAVGNALVSRVNRTSAR